jgi:hypothetical protein
MSDNDPKGAEKKLLTTHHLPSPAGAPVPLDVLGVFAVQRLS